jgi:hypothetical protein
VDVGGWGSVEAIAMTVVDRKVEIEKKKEAMEFDLVGGE